MILKVLGTSPDIPSVFLATLSNLQIFFLYPQPCFCLCGKLLPIYSDVALILPMRVKLSLVLPSPTNLTELSLAFLLFLRHKYKSLQTALGLTVNMSVFPEA